MSPRLSLNVPTVLRRAIEEPWTSTPTSWTFISDPMSFVADFIRRALPGGDLLWR